MRHQYRVTVSFIAASLYNLPCITQRRVRLTPQTDTVYPATMRHGLARNALPIRFGLLLKLVQLVDCLKGCQVGDVQPAHLIHDRVFVLLEQAYLL